MQKPPTLIVLPTLGSKKEVKKSYSALTENQTFRHIPANIENPRAALALKIGDSFEWKARILRGKRRAYESSLGKDSLTCAQFLGYDGKNYLRWDLQPITGRAHQLRFDLSRHGFPIIGDVLYGSSELFKEHAIALHSYKIDFSCAQGATRLRASK